MSFMQSEESASAPKLGRPVHTGERNNSTQALNGGAHYVNLRWARGAGAAARRSSDALAPQAEESAVQV